MVSGEKPWNIMFPLSVSSEFNFFVFGLAMEPTKLILFPQGNFPVGQFQHKTLIGIDDGAAAAGIEPGAVLAVIAVDVAVEEILGLVLVQQFHESLKTPMGGVAVIAKTVGRCVGHHNIHTLGTPQGEAELADPAAHFLLGVLMGAGMVPAAAAKA
jgi:hypothetical protein